MSSCPFCRIISGDLGSVRISENELAVAFLDIRPVNPGHTLVVPRRHVASLTDLTAAEAEAVFRLVQQVSSALKSELPGCEGFTISAADGEIAGQEVPHAHFHVIPRSAGDGFGWRRFGVPAEWDSLEAIAAVIRQSAMLAPRSGDTP